MATVCKVCTNCGPHDGKPISKRIRYVEALQEAYEGTFIVPSNSLGRDVKRRMSENPDMFGFSLNANEERARGALINKRFNTDMHYSNTDFNTERA